MNNKKYVQWWWYNRLCTGKRERWYILREITRMIPKWICTSGVFVFPLPHSPKKVAQSSFELFELAVISYSFLSRIYYVIYTTNSTKCWSRNDAWGFVNTRKRKDARRGWTKRLSPATLPHSPPHCQSLIVTISIIGSSEHYVSIIPTTADNV